jgi:hypothetical protein
MTNKYVDREPKLAETAGFESIPTSRESAAAATMPVLNPTGGRGSLVKLRAAKAAFSPSKVGNMRGGS